ncbi:MAG: hypothetical protein GY847_04810 [Proteobacteria bacterium]|nr:hypothetical protein [Pseudomonadota bacterium]
MAGPDNIKGVTFQHLCAILKALEILEDRDGGAIRIEGTQDVMDFEVFDSTDHLIYVAQAKSRKEPHTWSQAEIIKIIRQWADQGKESIETYEFLTDGQVGPRNEIPRILERLREEDETHTDAIAQLKKLGIDDIPLNVLQKMHIRTRYGEKTTLHERAILKVIRLLESTPKDSSYTSAKGLIANLFLEVSLAGGEDSQTTRLLSRERIFEILEIPSDVLSDYTPWTLERAIEYRHQIIKDFANPLIVELAAEGFTDSPPAAAFFGERQLEEIDSEKHMKVVDLIEETAGAALCSPTGGGKTSTLRFLAVQAARADRTPVYAEISSYQTGSLERVLRFSVEDRIGVRGDPRLIDRIISKESCAIILIDGITEIPIGERNALCQDTLDFRRKHPDTRIFVAGRQAEGLRRLQLPRYRLQPLNRNTRTEIIAKHLNASLPQADQTGSILESSLGSIVNIPLFLVMSLSLFAREESPSSRIEVYDGFLDGICYRHRAEVEVHTLIGAIACASYDLIKTGRKKAPRHVWLEMFKNALEEQKSLFSERSPESLIKTAEEIGILEKGMPSAYVGLLHDSFLDYFASVSISRGYRSLPATLSSEWEDAMILYAEKMGISADLAQGVLQDNLLLAVRLASLGLETDSRRDMEILPKLINTLFTIHIGEAIKDRLKISTDQANLVLYRTRKTLYASLSDDTTTQILEDQEEYEDHIENSIVTIATPRPCGPTRLITILWYALAHHALERQTDEYKIPKSPSNRHDLAEEIQRRFLIKRQILKEKAYAWVPSLATRLIEKVGMTGLRGYLLPARADPKSGKKKHRFSYKYVKSGTAVDLIEELPNLEVWRPRSTTTAEDYLAKNPISEALREVREFVEALRPRADDEVTKWEN